MRLNNLITAIDVHACGEPGRVITGGVLDVAGKSMFEKRLHFDRHFDHIRRRMLREPSVGEKPAVVPSLTGSGWIYRLSHYVVDDSDPFSEGFTVADIWSRGI